MIYLSRIARRPYIFPELLLALFLVVFTALFGPVFSPIAKLLGYAAVGLFFAELLYRGSLPVFMKAASPLWPYALFYVGMSIAVYPLIPYMGRVTNNITNFVAFAMVFFLVRKYRVLHSIDFAYLCIIITIGSMYYIFPNVVGINAAAQTRIKMSSDFLGTSEGGLNASGISLYCGLASFVALRCISTTGQGIRQFAGISVRSLMSWASLLCLVFSFVLVLIGSGSRQGLIWICFVVIAAFAIRFKRNIAFSIILSALAGIFLLGFMFLFLRETEMVQRILIVFDPTMMAIDPEKSLLNRWEMYKEGYRLWLESPLWGNGNEAFRVLSPWQGHYSHSNYIEILVNYGLLGFVLYYGPFLFLIGGSLSMLAQRKMEYRIILIWLIIAAVAILASGLFIPSFYRKPMVVFMGYMFAIYHNVNDDFRRRALRTQV